MFKIKLLVVLAAIVTTLVVAVAPASAEFRSTTGKVQGKIKSFPKESTFKVEPNSLAIVCKATNESGQVIAEGEWEIQKKAENKEGFQQGQLKGPHEQLKIISWGHCASNGVTVKVKCSLQIEQVTSTLFTGAVYPPGCVVFVGNSEENDCIVTVAAEAANRGLGEVKVANKGQSEVEIGSEVKGITSTSTESKELCKTLHIPKESKEGTFKTNGESLITEGQTTTAS